MIHECNGSCRKNPRDGDLAFFFTMDYLLHRCGLQSSDYRYVRLVCICSRSAPPFCKNCTLGGGGGGGGIWSQKAPFDCPKKILKVGETSTDVQFLLGFCLIYNIVILPPDQNNHSQSTGVKEISENPTCCQITEICPSQRVGHFSAPC